MLIRNIGASQRQVKGRQASTHRNSGLVKSDYGRRLPTKEQEAAEEVAPHVYNPFTEITRYGSVSKVNASDGSFFVVKLAPGATAKDYIIGDPYGLVAAAQNRAYDEPDDAPGTTVAALKAATQQGIAISAVHYQVSASPNQFANPFRLVFGNFDGSAESKPMNVLGTTRPDWDNDKLLVMEFGKPVILDSRRALTLRVDANEEATLNFFVAAFGV